MSAHTKHTLGGTLPGQHRTTRHTAHTTPHRGKGHSLSQHTAERGVGLGGRKEEMRGEGGNEGGRQERGQDRQQWQWFDLQPHPVCSAVLCCAAVVVVGCLPLCERLQVHSQHPAARSDGLSGVQAPAAGTLTGTQTEDRQRHHCCLSAAVALSHLCIWAALCCAVL